MNDLQQQSIDLHRQQHGKLSVETKMKVTSKEELSLAYSPGVAGPCKAIEADLNEYAELTSAAKTVAVISDGSAVLGLGDLGPKPAMPVMEGKCVLFKEFAGVNAFPLVVNTQDTEELIETIQRIAPSFGGINLEDISAPRCFDIEERLQETLDIPVFHDDQHGTAIVVLAALLNALTVTNRTDLATLRVVIAGAGAAGVAIAKLLHAAGVQHSIMTDSKGILSAHRDDLNDIKRSMLTITNQANLHGSLEDAVQQADVFIGVSVANILDPAAIRTMNDQPIVFALANPDPEVDPVQAKAHGAAVIATGRSDLPNQVNNVLAFPGIFKGLFDSKATRVTTDMKLAAAHAIASLVPHPSANEVIPSPFHKDVARVVAKAIAQHAYNTSS